MKRKIVGIAAILVLLLVLFFPFKLFRPLHLRLSISLPAPVEASNRALSSQQFWDNLDSAAFLITKRFTNSINLTLRHNRTELPGSIITYPGLGVSTTLEWSASMPEASSIFNLINQYFQARHVHKKMEAALNHLRSYCEKTENLYTFPISEGTANDSTMLITRFVSPSYPSPSQIYKRVAGLQKVASSAGVRQSGFPMLNVSTEDSVAFRCMVALPVNKNIANTQSDSIDFIRMIPGRQFLIATIKGGPGSIRHAHSMMELYILEHKRNLMAIPFESMVTDRNAVKDTSRWVTRIYAPVRPI